MSNRWIVTMKINGEWAELHWLKKTLALMGAPDDATESTAGAWIVTVPLNLNEFLHVMNDRHGSVTLELHVPNETGRMSRIEILIG